MTNHPYHRVGPDPLAQLSAAGVSVWLDDLSRELLAGGELDVLTKQRHVVGITSNPTIFASALTRGERYTEQLRQLNAAGASVEDAVFAMTTADVQSACRALRPIYETSSGIDGRVSIEVDPRLAGDADATVSQAHSLVAAVDEPNMFVKVPASHEGLAAITELTSQGISVNVTLIFSLDRYRAVFEAYLAGLEKAADAGRDLSTIHSVASFFVSRVDTAIDARLTAIGTPEALVLHGGAGIANARLAYEMFQQMLTGERWQELSERSNRRARPQRPLWASTGVKDPAYPDTMYVAELIAPQTVNTMPRATLEAFADHGVVRENTIAGTYDQARAHFAALARLGIDYQGLIDALEKEGLTKFENSWQELSDTVSRQLHEAAQKV